MFQQQGDNISVALLSCLVQRGVAHLKVYKKRGLLQKKTKKETTEQNRFSSTEKKRL